MYFSNEKINLLNDSDLEKSLRGKLVKIVITDGRIIGPVIVRSFCVTPYATKNNTISHLVLTSGEEIPRAMISELETLCL